jgi:hypothetical protein
MPLHKYPVYLWRRLRLREGICSRLPAHFLRSLEDERTPTAVHYRPHGAKFKINPKNAQRERVEDVPIPIHYPPDSQKGLWGGAGWIQGYRYANNDKVGAGRLRASRDLAGQAGPAPCGAPVWCTQLRPRSMLTSGAARIW